MLGSACFSELGHFSRKKLSIVTNGEKFSTLKAMDTNGTFLYLQGLQSLMYPRS